MPLVTAETCFWDPVIAKAKCIDCTCDTKQCALPDNCLKNLNSPQIPPTFRSRYDNNLNTKPSRFEYQRQLTSKLIPKRQQKKGVHPLMYYTYNNFWENQLESYDVNDYMLDSLYSDKPVQARKYVEPPPVKPKTTETPPKGLPPTEPAVKKLLFRKPYDLKKKPARHLVHQRAEPSALHKVIFRAPNELKKEIFKNFSFFHSLGKVNDTEQRRLEDLIGFLENLNDREMYGIFE